MPYPLKFICFALCLLFLACTIQHNDNLPTQIVVPGTGASEQILKIVAAAFNELHPESTIVIPKSTGTGGAINAVSNDTHILGRVGRPLNEDELKLGLTCLNFADDAVVFAVGSAVTVQNLTSEQLEAVFTGKITDWRDLGGGEGPIRVIIRQPTESSLKIIGRHFRIFKDYTLTDNAKCAFHDFEMVELLNKYPTSIGFLTNSSLNAPHINGLRGIAIDGIGPSQANLHTGKYPFMATYGLIFKKKRLSPAAEAFIDFIYSESGRKIILNHGLAPIARNS